MGYTDCGGSTCTNAGGKCDACNDADDARDADAAWEEPGEPILLSEIMAGHEDGFRWDDPGPDEMMPGCGHEVMDAAGTYDTGDGPAPGRGCDR